MGHGKTSTVSNTARGPPDTPSKVPNPSPSILIAPTVRKWANSRVLRPWSNNNNSSFSVASRALKSQAPTSSLASIPERRASSPEELTVDISKLSIASPAQPQDSGVVSTNSTTPHGGIQWPAVVSPEYVAGGVQKTAQNGIQVGRYLNPSNGPPPSSLATTVQPRRNGYDFHSGNSNASGKSFKNIWRKIKQNRCVIRTTSGTARDYHRGMIVWFPHITADQDPNADTSDPCFRLIETGPIYAKYRLGVITHVFKQSMRIAPAFSWTGRGLGSQPEWLWEEYVQVVDEGVDSNAFALEGQCRKYAPLIAKTQPPMVPGSTLHVTGAVTVMWNEEIHVVGSLHKKSIRAMMTVHEALCEKAH